MKAALIVAPVDISYSPIDPPYRCATRRLVPKVSKPYAPFNPVIRWLFSVAPDVLYAPTQALVKAPLATNRVDPEMTRPCGSKRPVIRWLFTTPPLVVYCPIVPAL